MRASIRGHESQQLLLFTHMCSWDSFQQAAAGSWSVQFTSRPNPAPNPAPARPYNVGVPRQQPVVQHLSLHVLVHLQNQVKMNKNVN